MRPETLAIIAGNGRDAFATARRGARGEASELRAFTHPSCSFSPFSRVVSELGRARPTRFPTAVQAQDLQRIPPSRFRPFHRQISRKSLAQTLRSPVWRGEFVPSNREPAEYIRLPPAKALGRLRTISELSRRSSQHLQASAQSLRLE